MPSRPSSVRDGSGLVRTVSACAASRIAKLEAASNGALGFSHGDRRIRRRSHARAPSPRPSRRRRPRPDSRSRADAASIPSTSRPVSSSSFARARPTMRGSMVADRHAGREAELDEVRAVLRVLGADAQIADAGANPKPPPTVWPLSAPTCTGTSRSSSDKNGSYIAYEPSFSCGAASGAARCSVDLKSALRREAACRCPPDDHAAHACVGACCGAGDREGGVEQLRRHAVA